MAQISSATTFFGVILVLLYCTCTISAGRMNVNDMDYDTIVSLLAEADNLESEPSNLSAESNIIPEYSHISAVSPTNQRQNSKRLSSHVSTNLNKNANIDFTITKPSASSVLAPHVEILHIVESFLRLKGEIASRIHALINDNFDLIQSLYNVVVAKASKFHSFTLIGISVIRKILEFAVQMIGTWEVNAPSVSFGVNKVFNAMG